MDEAHCEFGQDCDMLPWCLARAEAQEIEDALDTRRVPLSGIATRRRTPLHESEAARLPPIDPACYE